MKSKKSAANEVTKNTAKEMQKKAATVGTSSGRPSEGLQRLRVGDVFEMSGAPGEWVVYFVNDSRAAVAPLNSSFKHRINEEKGGLIQFKANSDKVRDISPNSEVKILRSLGREGFRDYVDQQENNPQKEDNMKKKAEKKQKKEPTHGKLGGYKGHSVTSVIRAFGKAGWTLDEARAFFKREGIDAADNTIKIQLRRGAKGEEEPAPLSKDELNKIKPKVAAAKSEKSEKKDKKAEKKGAVKKSEKPVKKSKPAPEPEPEEEGGEEEGDVETVAE